MFGHTRLSAAVRALNKELAGGPRADLGVEVRQLAELLMERERRRGLQVHQDAPEQELLAALPDAAALVSREGWVRVSNAAFDTLAAKGRAAGLTPLEITRSAELSDAVKRALEGTARRLDLAIGQRTYLANLAPLLRGEVLLLLRDVTDARRAEAVRRDFVANASHELRTPISAIRASAETLLSGAVDDPAAARHFIEIVSRHAERLARLTQDLLDLSRIESRQWRLDASPVDTAALGRQIVELLGATARDKGLELRSEIPEGMVVRGDARALEQVLVNLVDNGVKYTGAGSVVLQAARDVDDVILSVADTGPGIEKHHLPRIFERFYRIDPGRSREQGGTGLGLSIVKNLAEAMGGEAGVESGAGGSRFWLRLPAA
jgi:two-component system, OmpR family, phosphate regulon sensor histidine kinase PhoR